MTSERQEGKTPNGGVASEAFFMDDEDRPCEKEDATQMKIVEYNEQGSEIHRTYMTINK